MAVPIDRNKTPQVLVVEDEAKTRESVAEGLRLENWLVQTAASGEEAILRLGREPYDLMILDWMLPDCSGIDVLHHARQHGLSVAVMMLTARTNLNDRIVGLDSGADDYLAKPFAFAELVARCRALLRRPLWATGRVLGCADLELDTRARAATRGGEEIQLTPREVDVLEYLLRYQGQVVTREMLERDVWKQTHRATSLDNVIDVQIGRLRRKVDGERVDRLIHTVRGIGYRLARENI